MEAAMERIEFGTLAFVSAARGLNNKTLFIMLLLLPVSELSIKNDS